MTKRVMYSCDRCGENFDIPENERPDLIVCQFSETIDPNRHVDNSERKDLCPNCMATFSLFITEVKKFDNLADEIYKEKYPE
jgi:hypothetical protein